MKTIIKKIDNQNELNEIMSIRHQVFVTEQNVPLDQEKDIYDQLNSKCDHFIIYVDGEAAGTIRALKKTDEVVQLQRFCILKNFRGRGIAHDVMDFIERFYKARGVRRLTMHAQAHVKSLYARHGFREVSEEFLEANIVHVEMEKEI